MVVLTHLNTIINTNYLFFWSIYIRYYYYIAASLRFASFAQCKADNQY